MNPSQDKARKEFLLAFVFFVAGIMIWGSMLARLMRVISFENPYLWALALMLLLNAAH